MISNDHGKSEAFLRHVRGTQRRWSL